MAMKAAGLVSVVLALACAAGQASVLPNEAAAPLQQQATVLAAQGKYKDAIDKYQEAAKADPAASAPLSGIANVLLQASRQAQGDAAGRLRQQAESVARQALTLGDNDPLAQEVLRELLDDRPAPLHTPTPAAWKAVQEGEVLFHAQRYTEALAKYEEAVRLDPQYSAAEVYAGDCFFAQKKWPEAEERFRKATGIEPLNGQAWRFLADALSWQAKWSASEAALFNGIAAQPNQLPTWDKLASLRNKMGYPLTALHLQRKSGVKLDANGKFVINLSDEYSGDKGKLAGDGAMWFAYAAFEADARLKNQQAKVADQPFAIEVAAWRSALQAVDEVVANGGDDIHDPALLNLRMLAKAGQLEAGLILLQYRESWRPEFEAWKKEHPDGVRKFVNTYALRP
jgi:tetratricopeptide (TPR) repeat protein